MRHLIALLLLTFALNATAQPSLYLPASKQLTRWSKPLCITGGFAGGILAGKGEWELAAAGWPRNQVSHQWRDASIWATTGSALGLGISISLDGKINTGEILTNSIAFAASYWVGTRIGYYKLRNW